MRAFTTTDDLLSLTWVQVLSPLPVPTDLAKSLVCSGTRHRLNTLPTPLKRRSVSILAGVTNVFRQLPNFVNSNLRIVMTAPFELILFRISSDTIHRSPTLPRTLLYICSRVVASLHGSRSRNLSTRGRLLKRNLPPTSLRAPPTRCRERTKIRNLLKMNCRSVVRNVLPPLGKRTLCIDRLQGWKRHPPANLLGRKLLRLCIRLNVRCSVPTIVPPARFVANLQIGRTAPTPLRQWIVGLQTLGRLTIRELSPPIISLWRIIVFPCLSAPSRNGT